MKSKKKTVLTIIISLVLIFIVFAVWYCGFSGGSAPRKYKELFDKVFDKGYTITKTDTEFVKGSFKKGNMQAPYTRTEYVVEYTDKDGGKERFKLYDYSRSATLFDKKLSYSQFKDLVDENIIACINEAESNIAVGEAAAVLSKHFDVELQPEEDEEVFDEYSYSSMDTMKTLNGKGYEISVLCFDCEPSMADLYNSRNYKEWLDKGLKPENRKSLSEYTLKDHLNETTATFAIYILVDDEEFSGNIDDLKINLEKTTKELASMSDFGGNYRCSITEIKKTDEPSEDQNTGETSDKDERIRVFDKYVLFGEDVTDICKDDMYAFRELLFKKNGMDRIPYGE